MNTGFLPLRRDFFNDEYYQAEKFTKWQAHLDLIRRAEYKVVSDPIFIKGTKLRIQRGQIAISKLHLAEFWKWSMGTVDKYFKSMQQRGELTYKPFPERNPGLTIITLSYYDENCPKFENEPNFNTETTSETSSEKGSEITTSNNINNLNNINTNTINKQDITNEDKNILFKRNLSKDELFQKEIDLVNKFVEWTLSQFDEIGKEMSEADIRRQFGNAIDIHGYEKISELFSKFEKLPLPQLIESNGNENKTIYDEFWKDLDKLNDHE